MASKFNGAEAASRWIRQYQAEVGIPWCDLRRVGDNARISHEWIDTHGALALKLVDRLSVVCNAAHQMYPGKNTSTPGFREFRMAFIDLVLVYITTIRMMLDQRVNERVN